MNVICHYKNDDQPLTSAYPAKNGVLVRFCSGNVLDPYFGNWFKEPYFKVIIRYFTTWRLPYFSFRLGRFGGYVGFQCYGVDSPQYLNFLPAKDVYDGSLALSLTIRLTTNVD